MNFYNLNDKLSLIKISGLKYFAILDIFSSYINITFIRVKNHFYNISNKSDVQYDLIDNIKIDFKNYDLTNVKSLLLNKMEHLSISQLNLVIGINEFKYSKFSFSDDQDENILDWIDSNKNKFIPEEFNENDFSLFFEEYKKDDSTSYFYSVLVRQNLLDKLLLLNSGNISIISVIPTPLFIINNKELINNNFVLCNFEKEKLYFSYKTLSNDIYYQDFYYSHELNDLPSLIENSLHEIKQILLLNDFKLDSLTFVISEGEFKREEISSKINEIFPSTDIVYNKSQSILINKIINNYNSSINLLDENSLKTVREKIDKSVFSKITLFLCSLIAIILLMLFIIENVLIAKNNTIDEITYHNNYNKSVINKINIENVQLKNTLASLVNLKSQQIFFSCILEEVSIVFPSGSKLTSLSINSNKDSKLGVTLLGNAISQATVAQIISLMGDSNNLKNPTLHYSTIKNEDEEYSIDFKITCDYAE